METVKIKSSNPATQGDFIIINKDDFDDKVHELYVEPKAKASAKDKE